MPLTPKGFDLLVLLVSNAGRLVTKDEILDRIWPDVNVAENNLTTTVSMLRKALDENEQQHYIENVPKKGYRFVAPVEVCSPSAVQPPTSERSKRGSYLLPAIVVALVAAVGLGLWRGLKPPAPPEHLYQRAIELENQGNDKLALDVLNELLRAKPGFDDAGVRAAWIEYQDNEDDAGLRYVKAVIDREHGRNQNPEDAHARCTRLKAEGLELLLTEDRENALRKLQLATEADPTDADALYYRSDLASDMGLFEQADSLLTRCLRIDRSHPGCTFDLMVVRICQGRFNDVVAIQEQALKNGVQYPWLEEPLGYAELANGNAERALAHFRTLEASGRQLSSSVHFRASQEGVAEVAMYQGRVDDARRKIIAALQTSGSPYDKASYFLYLAQIDVLNGHPADAKQEVQTALQTSPSANLAITAARVLAAGGDLQGAHQLLQEHRSSAAGLGTTYSATEQFLVGAELRSKSDLNQSISAIADAYRFDPDPAFAYYLARLQMQAGRWKDAIETLKQLLNIRGTFMMGDSPALLIPLAERDLGICEKHLGNLSKAVEYFSMVKALWSQADPGLKNTLVQAETP